MCGKVDKFNRGVQSKGGIHALEKTTRRAFYVFVSIAMVDNIIFAGPNQSVQMCAVCGICSCQVQLYAHLTLKS